MTNFVSMKMAIKTFSFKNLTNKEVVIHIKHNDIFNQTEPEEWFY